VPFNSNIPLKNITIRAFETKVRSQEDLWATLWHNCESVTRQWQRTRPPVGSERDGNRAGERDG